MPKKKFTPEERLAAFWSKVDKTPGFGPWSNCWIWRGSGCNGRTPHFFDGSKVVIAYRWIFEKTYGYLGDMKALHKCDVGLCVRPDHLFKGTLKDNSQDCKRKGRRAPCHGEHNGNAKLTQAQADAIRIDKRPARIIAAEYGCYKGTVDGIRQGKFWKPQQSQVPMTFTQQIPPKHKPTTLERFWSFVDKTEGQGPHGTCWTWKGEMHTRGNYGLFHLGTKDGKRIRVRAARWIYEQIHGPLGKLFACHSCDFPPCVRPDHIEPGDQWKNMGDAAKRGRVRFGMNHHNCKLSDEDVLAIRADTRIHRLIAADYGVSKDTVRNIKSGSKRKRLLNYDPLTKAPMPVIPAESQGI